MIRFPVYTLWLLCFISYQAFSSLQGAVHHTAKLKAEDDGIEIELLARPIQDILTIARYNNPISSVTLRTKGSTQELSLTPRTEHWEIELPKLGKVPKAVVFIKTIGKPRLAGPPVLLKPTKEGSLHLSAHTATPIGARIRYEPQPEKNTLGFWADEEDFAEWTFKLNKPGRYRIEILQGCGKGQGGSIIGIELGDNQLTYKVKETGHFQTFERHRVGTVTLKSTEPQVLRMIAVEKKDRIVADIRAIFLTPLN